jgi:hypothetical protein
MRISAALAAIAVTGVIASLVAAGCSPVSSGAEGVSCTEQSDCNSGLTCLPYLQINADGGCASLATACLQKCETNEDCANLAPGFACMTSCGGTFACEPEMIFTDTDTDAGAVADADAGSPRDAADAQGQ